MGRFILIGLLICSVAHAQQVLRPQDTLRVVHGDSVQVTALREASLPAIDARSAIVRSVDVLTRVTGSELASTAFRAIGSSLNVRRYGPLGGSAFASFRGLPAEYTAVYRDGIPVPSEQNSLVDLGQLSLAGIDRVELVPSAEAIVLGGDAIGAAINLVSRDHDTSIVRLNSALKHTGAHEAVSDITSTAQFALHPAGSFAMLAGLSDANSTGRYPFAQPGRSDRVIRAFDDAALTSQFGSILWTPNTRDEVRLHASHFAVDRGLPGPASIPGFGASLVNTRQTDDQLFTSADYTHLDSTSAYGLTGGYQHQFESYTRPATNTHDSARTSIVSALARWRSEIGEFGLFGGLGYSRTALTGTTNALPNGDNSVSRERTNGYIAATAPLLGANLTAAVRAEQVSGTSGVEWLPQASLTVPVWQELALHAAYGRAFHPPTFNELYWSSEGGVPNPDLRPERAESWSVMLHTPIEIDPLQVTLAATYFHTRVIDEILWLASGSSTSTPYNLGPVVTGGVELRLGAHASLYGLDITIDESYTLTDARVHDPQYDGREVPYSSPSSSLLTAEVSRNGIGCLSISASYIGHRYTDPANSESSRLEPATTIDLAYEVPAISFARVTLIPRVSVANATDLQRSEFPGYPLPGRTYTLTISLSY